MRLHCTLLVSVCLVTMAMGSLDVRTILKRRPPVMSNFNEQLWMGRWFKQRWFAPCSWAGASKFIDQSIYNEYTSQPGLIKGHCSWKMNGECVLSTEHLMKEKTPGTYKVIDPIGDVLTGEGRVVVTDYHCYSIFWGCTKPNIVDPLLCDDPWLSITTRNPFPDPKRIKMAAVALKSVFGFPLNDMLQVAHTSGCVRRPAKKCHSLFLRLFGKKRRGSRHHLI